MQQNYNIDETRTTTRMQQAPVMDLNNDHTKEIKTFLDDINGSLDEILFVKTKQQMQVTNKMTYIKSENTYKAREAQLLFEKCVQYGYNSVITFAVDCDKSKVTLHIMHLFGGIFSGCTEDQINKIIILLKKKTSPQIGRRDSLSETLGPIRAVLAKMNVTNAKSFIDFYNSNEVDNDIDFFQKKYPDFFDQGGIKLDKLDGFFEDFSKKRPEKLLPQKDQQIAELKQKQIEDKDKIAKQLEIIADYRSKESKLKDELRKELKELFDSRDSQQKKRILELKVHLQQKISLKKENNDLKSQIEKLKKEKENSVPGDTLESTYIKHLEDIIFSKKLPDLENWQPKLQGEEDGPALSIHDQNRNRLIRAYQAKQQNIQNSDNKLKNSVLPPVSQNLEKSKIQNSNGLVFENFSLKKATIEQKQSILPQINNNKFQVTKTKFNIGQQNNNKKKYTPFDPATLNLQALQKPSDPLNESQAIFSKKNNILRINQNNLDKNQYAQNNLMGQSKIDGFNNNNINNQFRITKGRAGKWGLQNNN